MYQSAAVIISSWPYLFSFDSFILTSLDYFEVNLKHYINNKGNCIFDGLQVTVLRIVAGINNGTDNSTFAFW